MNPGKERCSQCGMTFDKSQQLDDHLDAHFRANMKVFKIKNLKMKVMKINEEVESRKMFPTIAVSLVNVNTKLIVC